MCLVHTVIKIWFAESQLPLSPSSLPSCCHWMILHISKNAAQRKVVASFIFTSMAPTLSSWTNCFHLKGRYFVSGLFLLIFSTARSLIEFYCPSPMFIGYWFGGVCLLPALSALMDTPRRPHLFKEVTAIQLTMERTAVKYPDDLLTICTDGQYMYQTTKGSQELRPIQ